MTTERSPKTYSGWMRQLDRLTQNRFGMSIHDFPDMCFRDAFDDERTPEDFLDEEVTGEAEEMGYGDEDLANDKHEVS